MERKLQELTTRAEDESGRSQELAQQRDAAVGLHDALQANWQQLEAEVEAERQHSRELLATHEGFERTASECNAKVATAEDAAAVHQEASRRAEEEVREEHTAFCRSPVRFIRGFSIECGTR